MGICFKSYRTRIFKPKMENVGSKTGGPMRRKLFFILEKLEIKRSERIAISFLLVILVTLSGILTYLEPAANYDEEKYRELEKVFREKSEAVQAEKNMILARYEPDRDVQVPVTVIDDSEPVMSEPDTTDEEKSASESDELININTATSEQLRELPGIGPAYAGRIVAWRVENGEFSSKDQLLEIKGIGEKRLSRIKPLITLE